MSTTTKAVDMQIPLGAQHISLLEPVKFTFTTQNEKIVDVGSDVGFVHRGVEHACSSKFEFKQVGFVVARICGLCAITHSMCYTAGVEKLLDAQVTQKAKYLRTLLIELDRIHSHMLCLSHTCENAGFEAMFMSLMGDREPVMGLQEAITGNRVQFDYITIGGVTREFDAQTAQKIIQVLGQTQKKIEGYIEEFQNNWSLSKKFEGIGALSPEGAYEYNAIGPLARACGLQVDVRNGLDYLPYKEVGFTTITQTGGDIHARNMVRLYEILNSIKMCRNIVEGLPEGEIQTKVRGKPQGEVITRLEAPRGELMYYLKGENKKVLDRVRIKTPTFATIPAMIEIFKGQDYADAPAILASFDPCLSCTAK